MLRSQPVRWLLQLVVGLLLVACSPDTGATNAVVVYVSVDQPHAEPVLARFEEQTGIDVQAVYDTEATKTTGLVTRLYAEREQPQADVFWSSEIA
ncbi:MAG: ABC transporter substrate-binding protein, partial [Anaerolineae bacterium]|nr:ABC transporter substrate-binding protein [Anaerolineae bacterium]